MGIVAAAQVGVDVSQKAVLLEGDQYLRGMGCGNVDAMDIVRVVSKLDQQPAGRREQFWGVLVGVLDGLSVFVVDFGVV
jgi:hypothetical protein